MVIYQRSPLLFAPFVTEAQAVQVIDVPGSTDETTVLSIVFDETTGAEFHNDYLLTGIGLTNISLYDEQEDGAVDINQFPLVSRNDGFAGSFWVRLTNGKGITDKVRLNFSNLSGTSFLSPAKSVVADTYAEYSWERVKEVFDGLTSPAMFGPSPSYNRINGTYIPHAQLTGQVFDGGYGPLGGRRFCAITPRHVIGCAHYGTSNYRVGTVLKFKTADNVVVTRTVTKVWSGWDIVPDTPGSFYIGQVDIALFLLDSDLPATIKPFKIADEFYRQLQEGSTDHTTLTCNQAFGISLFGNDGHICPVQFVFNSVEESSWVHSPLSFGGGAVTMTTRNSLTLCPYAGITLAEHPDWNHILPSSPFYHVSRGGDSGSPLIIPVADDEWALCGTVAGVVWEGELINDLIAYCESLWGVSTGHSVSIAPDPTA